MELVRAAADFAAASHLGQCRKYSQEPYIHHPARVAARVAELGCDAEVIAAAWLHDVVEDCGVTVAQLAARFGDRVARLVHRLSEPPAQAGGARVVRKATYRRRLLVLQGRDAIDVHTVKAADCLDNVRSVREHDPGFWRVYGRETRLLCNVLTLAHPDLLDELRETLKRPAH